MNCLQCNGPIMSGRADRKFCSRDCKDGYHNAKKMSEHVEIARIVSTLKNNRRILKKILGELHELLVGRDLLIQKGFDDKFYTHHLQQPGELVTCCFDVGWKTINHNEYKIIQITTILPIAH